MVTGSSLGEPVLRSTGATESDRLTAPSWDGQGDLWVADRNPDAPRLLLLQKGGGTPVVVRTPSLDGRINAVRVAADGVRIALVVEKDGKQTLLIGRIERDQKPGEQQPSVSVQELRSATPELEQVTAVSWAGDEAGSWSSGGSPAGSSRCSTSSPTAPSPRRARCPA